MRLGLANSGEEVHRQRGKDAVHGLLLTSLAVESDGKLVVPEKLTQQDIAERVGASRDMISRLMKDLVGGGYLAVEERTITILKKPPPGW